MKLERNPRTPSNPDLPAITGQGVDATTGGSTRRAQPFSDGFEAPVRAPSTPPLPPRIAAAKRRVIELTSENTLRTDNVKAVRAELEPLIDELETWFATNRPANEVALTRGAWKSLWYDDENIDRDEGLFRIDRGQIYQVVRDGFYYNVSDNPVVAFGQRIGTTHSFLKGNYDIIDPATPERAGDKRLNVVDLEFDKNRLRFGKTPRGEDLIAMVDAVDQGDRFTLPIPGPRGITGELWNAYVDKDLRISRGQQDDDPGVSDLYILRRVRAAED